MMDPKALDSTKNLNLSQRLSEEDAGYMELEGAEKDADCKKVDVDGGVSSGLGCCNEFEPDGSVQEFKCANCEYLIPK